MSVERVTNYVDKLEPYLTPDSGNFDDVRPALMSLVLPYEVDPWRYFHTVKHLEEKLEFLVAHAEEFDHPRVVFGASPGHDTLYYPWLYNPQLGVKGINEAQSSEMTQRLFTPHFKLWEVSKMGQFIEVTAHHPSDLGNTDLGYFLDSDMRIIGAPPERFEEYEGQTSSEFTWLGTVARKQYLMGRLAFFASVKGKLIYNTDAGRDLYQAQADTNITDMTARHTAELERL
ncbi:hypothetical protein KC973_02325 [Candidatus Saccharibacteria bacterium]|nr:hypothetical protein [Candidatus Saccharibacteria bacterium]